MKKSTTTTTANDNGRVSAATILAGLASLLDGTSARWTLDGWAAHLAASRHPIHAVNSFLKHERPSRRRRGLARGRS